MNGKVEVAHTSDGFTRTKMPDEDEESHGYPDFVYVTKNVAKFSLVTNILLSYAIFSKTGITELSC